MSTQTKSYIEDMKKMYIEIKNKKKLSQNDLLFLIMYKRTIDNSIEV